MLGLIIVGLGVASRYKSSAGWLGSKPKTYVLAIALLLLTGLMGLGYLGLAVAGCRVQLVTDGLDPEDGAEDGEERPFEGIGPAQGIAGHSPAELPVAEPPHPDERHDREQVPAEPPGRDKDPPARRLWCLRHGMSLAPVLRGQRDDHGSGNTASRDRQ